MTAYEVLRTINTFIDITETEYNRLIANFHNSFLSERNYEERLMLHRNPVELQNGMLRDVYEDLTTIQRREELRYVHSKGERLVSTYVATEIEDVWKADKRLPSLFYAIKEFSKRTGRNFTETAVHQAEFKALCDLAHELQQSIYNHEMAKTPNSSFSKMKGKKVRAKIPREGKVRAELQKEINSVCPFCSSDDVGHFEIHHIDEDPSNNKNDNLLLLCPTCHSKITKGDITLSEVILTKKKMITGLETRKVPVSKDIRIRASVANVISGSNNTINIAQGEKPSKLEFPPGCIGYDPVKANYVDYLIDRYNIYKKWEEKEKMNYALFRIQLKNKFKIGGRKIEHIPTEKFDELTSYIQFRINNTKLAKVNGPSHRNYSSFTEYKAQAI